MWDIPIELFIFGIAFSLVFTVFGFMTRPYRQHWMIIATGLFTVIFSAGTDNITMGYAQTGSIDTITHYNIQSSTGQVLINSVTAHSRGERLSNTSSDLHGDTIDCITVYLGRSGSPPSDTLIRVGVMNTDTIMIKQFGSMNVTSLLSNAVSPYTFCLPIGDTYKFIDTETVGIKWDSGDSSNTLTTRVDANNPFDGNDTEHVHATSTSFIANTSQDIMMILSLRGNAGMTEPINFEFTEWLKVIFVLQGTMILFCSIILMRSEK